MHTGTMEYFLEDVVSAASHMPRRYFLPTDAEINRLVVGNIVYVIFLVTANSGMPKTQKVAVELTRVNAGRLFSGIILSELPFINPVKGDVIRFKKENIAGIQSKSALDLKVSISTKALEEKQVNVVTRLNEGNTTWGLYFDDEDIKSNTGTEVKSLDEILDFEPRLQMLLSVKGGDYFVYCVDCADFVES